MKYKISKFYHFLGGIIIVLGFLFALRAAGLADLNGDFNSVINATLCGGACMACGIFLRWWRL